MGNKNIKLDFSKCRIYVPIDKLHAILSWQKDRCFRENLTFAVSTIRININHSKRYTVSRSFVYQLALNSLNLLIPEHKGYVSLDNENLVVLFVESSESYAKHILNETVRTLLTKLSDSITVALGTAECPTDGVDYVDLVNSACINSEIVDNKQFSISSVLNETRNWHDEVNKSLENIESNIKSALFKELSNLIYSISSYDRYLGDHSALVAQGSILLATEMGLKWKNIEKIAIAALLRDIGYITIPKELFNKKGALTPDEWKIIKLHPTIACEHILNKITIMSEYLPIIQNHHEFLDGSGYPKGKKGDQIPIESQIISIVDTYHAMRVDRPYRDAMSFEEIIDFYIKNAGIKWNEELITIFTAIIADNELNKRLNEKESLSLSLIMKQS